MDLFGLADLVNQLVLQVFDEAALLGLAALDQGGHVDALLHQAVGQEQSLLQLQLRELFVQVVELLIFTANYGLKGGNFFFE